MTRGRTGRGGERFRDYAYDRAAEKRYRWGYFSVISLVVLAALAGAAVYSYFIPEDRTWFVVSVSCLFGYALIAGIGNVTRGARGGGRGRRMKKVHVDLPKRERTRSDRDRVYEMDGDAMYTTDYHDLDDSSTVYRVMQKVFVCDDCRRYFVALRRSGRQVYGGHEGVEKQKRFRKKIEKLRRRGAFDRFRRKKGDDGPSER